MNDTENVRKSLKWLVLGLVASFLIYVGILVTAWLILNVSGFYFFWSYGLSAVASYMLTDLTSKRIFERVRYLFKSRYQGLQAVTFAELIFSTAILASLLDYEFKTALQDYIVGVLVIGYPLLVGLAIAYYYNIFKVHAEAPVPISVDSKT